MQALGISDFGLFCLAVLLLNATPGPDTAYIVGRSLAQGRGAGLVSALGISAGCCLHALASALGLSALLAASANAFLLIKLAGGAYLVYLGVRLLLTPAANGSGGTAAADVRPFGVIFWQALATNVLNPKVILFFLAFIPQFVQAEAPHPTASFFLLGIILALLSLGWNSGTALVAGAIASRTLRSDGARAWLQRLVGATFIGIGLKLALSRN